jgi:hypothetical protein
VLAVIVDFESSQATVGSQAGAKPPVEAALAAIEGIGYKGELVKIDRGE